MRITLVLPFAGTAGGTRVVATYADRLHKRGHQIVVVSTPKRDPGLGAKLRSFAKGNGWPRALGPSHFDHVDVDHRVIDRYRPIIDADVPDADVVIATWWETAEWVSRLSPAKGVKAYFIQHDETQLSDQKDRVIATWGLPMHKVTIAQWLADLGKTRAPDDAIALVPNAVDLNQFNAPARGKQRTPTVGVMYSQAKFKGCDIAVRAYELAKSEIPSLKLVAFGTQEPNASLPLPEGARYVKDPPQDEIRGIYADCDAWLFASRSEGFGLPILEAMACRTPVIAAPAGAAPELLSPGGGILVPGEDPSQMARAINQICSLDDNAWRAMSDIAYQTATKYTWDDATSRFEEFLTRIVSHSTAA
jgi:glycosyltransferase involved in cell wall biosynthesis